MRSRCLAMCMLLVAARAVPLVWLDTSGLEIHGASCIVFCSHILCALVLGMHWVVLYRVHRY